MQVESRNQPSFAQQICCGLLLSSTRADTLHVRQGPRPSLDKQQCNDKPLRPKLAPTQANTQHIAV